MEVKLEANKAGFRVQWTTGGAPVLHAVHHSQRPLREDIQRQFRSISLYVPTCRPFFSVFVGLISIFQNHQPLHKLVGPRRSNSEPPSRAIPTISFGHVGEKKLGRDPLTKTDAVGRPVRKPDGSEQFIPKKINNQEEELKPFFTKSGAIDYALSKDIPFPPPDKFSEGL